jgi:ferredoxin
MKKTKETCPHHGRDCYAVMLNGAGEGKKVFSMDLCSKCGAHKAPSGICLNACHLSEESRKRFSAIMQKAVDATKGAKNV